MAKIRLNQERRDILDRHAAALIEQTPDDPAKIKARKKAFAKFKKATVALHEETRKVLDKLTTPQEYKILKKFKALRKGDTKFYFVPQADNTGARKDPFYVGLHSDILLKHTDSGAALNMNMTYEQREAYDRRVKKAREDAKVIIPKNFRVDAYNNGGNDATSITPSAKLMKLHAAYEKAKDEFFSARDSLADARHRIYQDYRALIASYRTYEDVCEVWPEAKDVADQIMASTQQVSIMSNEAIGRIAANVKLRHSS